MLVLDIDGTLINKQGKISSADRLAVFQARKAGVILALCTGRSIAASLEVLKELELDGAHIFFDGTLVYDPQKEIEVYSQPIPIDLAAEMTHYAVNEKVPLDLFSKSKYFVMEESWRTELRREFFGIEAVVTDLRSIYHKERIIKGGIVVKTQKEIELAKTFAVRFADKLNLTWSVTPAFPGIQFINVVGKGTSKGQALKALCAYLKIPVERVCAIGDGANDISLVSTAGLGIAMKNSPPELISCAHYITADIEDSGVAKAVNTFVL
jgi:5-amino-6-(5-phospho-D-ribitylamino)uracil phosphatase